MSIIISLDGLVLDVEGSYDEGYPELHTYPNGDPGYPEEPPSFYADKVFYKNVEVTELISTLEDLILQLVKKSTNNKYLHYYNIWDIIEEECLKEINK